MAQLSYFDDHIHDLPKSEFVGCAIKELIKPKLALLTEIEALNFVAS